MRLAFLLGAVSLAAPAAAAASFDCTAASTPDERAICASPMPSALDVLVSRTYGEAHAKGADAQDRARALDDARLFNARKARCGADAGCLAAAHAGALADFATLGSTVEAPAWLAATDMTAAVPAETDGLPSREGACARSHVTAIGGRLEGEAGFDSGTTVELADGLHRVIYDRVEAIVGARRGDPVLVCLTSIPKRCSPGDDRGRFYTATDLATHRSWSLPDAQHMCGGA